NQGKIYVYQRDFERAAEVLNESVAIALETHEPRLANFVKAHLAHLYLKCEQYPEALQSSQQAREIDLPENAPYTAALHGLILARTGQLEAAQAALREALSAAQDLLDKTQ